MTFWKKITVEVVAFSYILVVFCEFTALQELVFTSTCMTYINTTDPSLCDKHGNDTTTLQITRIEAVKMKYYMGLMGLTALLATFFTGSWSDKVGRKLPMILPSALGIFAEIILVIVSVFLVTKNLTYLIYVAAIFNGISGGSSSVIAACFGYISDITVASERTKRVTLLEAMFFIGGFCGFNLAGLLITHVINKHFEVIFAICALGHLLVVLYIHFVLKDSRVFERVNLDASYQSSTETSTKGLFNLSHVSDMFSVVFRRRYQPNDRLKILLLLFCSIISSCAIVVQTATIFVFVKKPPLNWNSSNYSLFSGLNFLVSGLALITVVPLIVRRWPNVPDEVIGFVGFLSKFAGLLVLGISNTSPMVFATIALFSCSEWSMPAIRSMLSKIVDSDETGRVMAFNAGCQSLVMFLGSIAFYSIYTASAAWFPGLAFEVAAILQSFAALTFM